MDVRARYESDDVAWLAVPDAQIEWDWLERKEWLDKDEVGRQASGFANGPPDGGLLVVGVAKDGRFVGVEKKGKPALQDRLDAIGRVLRAGEWEYRLVSIENEQLLFVHVLPVRNRVVRLPDGTAFRRVGSTTKRLTDDEIRELRYARGEISFEDEPAVPYDESLVDDGVRSSFLAGMEKRNGLTMPITFQAAIEQRRLLTKSNGGVALTNAGLLVLAKDPAARIPGARLRFLRFEGSEEKAGTARNVVKDQYFDGPIPRIVSSFREFMRGQVREFDYLGTSGTFVHDVEYPEVVWEEAVVNALVHRSYSLTNATVFVRMFDDRLEVESPGGFPGPTPPTTSYPTNRHLAEALQYLGLVRLAREGTRRMQETMAAAGLPDPEFDELPGQSAVIVTLRNDVHRRRPGAAKAMAEWKEIGGLLRDDLAIRQRSALRRWQALAQQGARPPDEVMSAAVSLIRNRGSLGDIVIEVVSLLEQASPFAERVAGLLAQDLVSGTVPPQIAERLAYLLSKYDAVVERVLTALEAGDLSVNVLPALLVLNYRLDRSLPDRPWLDRVLVVCRRYEQLGPAVKLYEKIAGRPPP